MIIESVIHLSRSFRPDEAALKLINVLNSRNGSVWLIKPKQMQPFNVPDYVLPKTKWMKWWYNKWLHTLKILDIKRRFSPEFDYFRYIIRMETLLHKRKENKWRKNPSSALPTLKRTVFAWFFFRKSLWVWEKKYQNSRQSQSRNNSDSAKTPLVK